MQTATERKREKYVQNARFALKWMPFCTFLFVGTGIFVYVRVGGHWTVENLLYMVSVLGGFLYSLAHWQQARQMIQSSKSPLRASLILGLLWMMAGSNLADMHRHHVMVFFYTVGIGTLAVSLLCVVLIVFDIWREMTPRAVT